MDNLQNLRIFSLIDVKENMNIFFQTTAASTNFWLM